MGEVARHLLGGLGVVVEGGHGFVTIAAKLLCHFWEKYISCRENDLDGEP
jgi:hypothetical protein